MNDIQLSDHFWLSEFTASEIAARLGRPIVVEEGDPIFLALKGLAIHILEPVRAQFGRTIITSGYRPLWLNRMVGSADDSQHPLGEAADFKVPGRSVEEVARGIAASDLPFDKLIWEFNAWAHVSYGPKQRRSVLTAKHGEPRADGRNAPPVYLTGLVPFTDKAGVA